MMEGWEGVGWCQVALAAGIALPPYGVMGNTCVVPLRVLIAAQRLSQLNAISCTWGGRRLGLTCVWAGVVGQ